MMKVLIYFLLIALFLAGGFGAYRYFGSRNVNQTTDESVTVSVTGVVRKLPKPGDDYTHTITTSKDIVKLNSYSVNLDDYVGKTVTMEGQYSGTTLYVDVVR